jgi:type IV fimbrial biogenesis protein FimT
MRLTRNTRRRFSMIEIMLVLVIVSILLVIAMPAFNKLVLGSNVDGGARLVLSQIRLARQYAITNRVRVAVLLPAKDFPSDGTATGSTRYKASSVRSCIVDSGKNFVEYVAKTQWAFLPMSVYIDDITNAAEVDGVKFPELTSSDTANNVRSIIFLPSGSVEGGTDVGPIEIEEMILSGSSLQTKDAGSNKVSVTINWLTGRVIE